MCSFEKARGKGLKKMVFSLVKEHTMINSITSCREIHCCLRHQDDKGCPTGLFAPSGELKP